MIKLGTTDLSAVNLGATEVAAAYLGTTQVWSATPPAFDRQALIDAFKIRVAADSGTFEAEASMLAALDTISDADLTNAKLVLTPNAFKASKLYSAIGTDFTVARLLGRSRVTSALALAYLSDNVPAIDYSAGASLPAVLVEPTKTNLYADPLDYSTGNWQRLRLTQTSDATAAPDGTTTADRLAEDTVNNAHLLIQVRNATSGQQYSVSGFAKKGTGASAPAWVQMLCASATFGSTQYAAYNLDTGAVVTVGGATAARTPLANGWARTSITATATSTGSGNQTLYAFSNNASAPRLPAYPGNVNADLYAWGAQLETGSPTSFIPVTNAGGVRNADVISVAVPPGTAQIRETVDGATNVITSIPATYTLPVGRVSLVVML